MFILGIEYIPPIFIHFIVAVAAANKMLSEFDLYCDKADAKAP